MKLNRDRDSYDHVRSESFEEPTLLSKATDAIGKFARDYLLERFPIPLVQRTPLAFPTALLTPRGPTLRGKRSDVATISPAFFQPERLVCSVPGDPGGVTVLLTNIFVGSDSCLVNNNALTVALFQASSVDCQMTFPVAGPGIQISLQFESCVANEDPIEVFPAMLGVCLQQAA
jgi:hypothetical protein